jgi:hypothetical protein
LIERGTWFANCLPAFPSITPTCWATLATGAKPATHGVTCQFLHLPGTALDDLRWGYSSETCLAERFWEAGARIGKRAVVLHCPTSGPARSENVLQVNGTSCDAVRLCAAGGFGYHGFGPRLFSTKTGNIEWHEAGSPPSGQWAGQAEAAAVKLTRRDGGLLARLRVESSDALFYGLGIGKIQPLDWFAVLRGAKVALQEAPAGPVLADLTPGQWSPVLTRQVVTANGSRALHGRAKLLAADETSRKLALFFTPLADPEPGITPQAHAAAIAGLEGVPMYCDHASFLGPEKIDNETHLEIEAMNLDWQARAIQYGWSKGYADATVAYTVMMDTINHSHANVLEGISGTAAEREKARDLECRAYAIVDGFVGRLVEGAGPEALIVLASDHGRVGHEGVFNPWPILKQAGLLVTEPKPDGKGEQVIWEKTQAIPFGSVHIYVNLKGREPQGSVEPADYDAVVNRIVAALADYTDQKTGLKAAVVLRRSDAALLGLGGERTGDVVWGVTGRLGGYFGGIHACQIPTASSATGDIRSLLLLAGPGMRRNCILDENVYQWDVAPTLCHCLGWPAPAQSDGRVIHRACAGGESQCSEIN